MTNITIITDDENSVLVQKITPENSENNLKNKFEDASGIIPKEDISDEIIGIFNEEYETAPPELTSIFDEISKDRRILAMYFVELFRELGIEEPKTPFYRWIEQFCNLCLEKDCSNCGIPAETKCEIAERWLQSPAFEDDILRKVLLELVPGI